MSFYTAPAYLKDNRYPQTVQADFTAAEMKKMVVYFYAKRPRKRSQLSGAKGVRVRQVKAMLNRIGLK